MEMNQNFLLDFEVYIHMYMYFSEAMQQNIHIKRIHYHFTSMNSAGVVGWCDSAGYIFSAGESY